MDQAPKILLADGNTKDRNDAMKAVGGELGAERYANEIRRMYPGCYRWPPCIRQTGDGYLPSWYCAQPILMEW